MDISIRQDGAMPVDWAGLRGALRAADGAATVIIDPLQSRLRFEGRLTPTEVLALLHARGVDARPIAAATGGSTCCGGCG